MARARKPIPIAFPESALPGEQPSEGQGDLINAYYEKHGDRDTWRRAPGVLPFTDTGIAVPRGMINVNGTLYCARTDAAVRIDQAGTVTPISGLLSGSQPVTWAQNNKSPTPDVVCVTELGAFVVTSSTVSALSDLDLPPGPLGVDFLNGYYIFPFADGRMFASDLNSTAINALSFAKCEAKPDGLLRGAVSAGLWYGFGPESTEVWQDVGASPFPLQRVATIPVGIAGRWCIAGQQAGWDLPLIFVAADNTVRMMQGYDPTPVSTPDVQRDIQRVADKNTLFASVFVTGGHAFWVLTSPSWTWVFDASTGKWHRRTSYGAARWRFGFSVYFGGRWITAEVDPSTSAAAGTTARKLYAIDADTQKDDTDPLIFSVEGLTPSFPLRVRIKRADFDFTVGQGNPLGSVNETDPQVSVQWSKDGGATWSPISTTKALGAEGQFSRRICVNRIGRSTHHGIRFRLSVADPVHVVFRGGTMQPADL